MEYQEDVPNGKELNEDRDTCPKCGSKNIDSIYVSCLCHRTYEGDGRTCWKAPRCEDCGFQGDGNSAGGVWFPPKYWYIKSKLY